MCTRPCIRRLDVDQWLTEETKKRKNASLQGEKIGILGFVETLN
jgi:hypothetical protein